MSKKTFLFPLFTFLVMTALAFVNVQPASAAEASVEVTLTGTVMSIDEVALSLVIKTAEDVEYVVFAPAGFDMTTLSIGDSVEVTGTSNEDGSIAATGITILYESVEVTLAGTVMGIDELTFSLEILVEDDQPYTIFTPEGFDLTTLSLGDMIEVTGMQAEDNSVLASEIAILFEAVEVTITGNITTLDELTKTFTVETEGGETFTFIVTDETFDWTSLAVGDLVEANGMQTEDGSVILVALTFLESEDDETNDGYYCTQSDVQHPFGARLAERYQVDYATLQGWFCDGFGWGQIMLALQTGQISEADPADLLAAREAGSGWGQIWQELKLIGKDKDAYSPKDLDGDGRPDHAGPPSDEDGDGRPDHAGPPNDEDGDGRPDHAGPPNDEDGDGHPDHPTPQKNPKHNP
ncbi:MAG: DUF5666 domain-containing protein [Chloroflexota bacterium]